jgi:U3 small nucleolar RNA-associated protein 21
VLGCITEATPFAVQRRGRATFVTVSVGDAWQLYNCAKLTLVLVSQPVRSMPAAHRPLGSAAAYPCTPAPRLVQLGYPLCALASSDDFTYAAYGAEVAVFRRYGTTICVTCVLPVLQ